MTARTSLDAMHAAGLAPHKDLDLRDDGTLNRYRVQGDKAESLNGHTFEQGEFRQLRARFARRGYTLQRVYRAHDGRATFHIMRGARNRVLSHPHDVRAYLAVIEGAPV